MTDVERRLQAVVLTSTASALIQSCLQRVVCKLFRTFRVTTHIQSCLLTNPFQLGRQARGVLHSSLQSLLLLFPVPLPLFFSGLQLILPLYPSPAVLLSLPDVRVSLVGGRNGFLSVVRYARTVVPWFSKVTECIQPSRCPCTQVHRNSTSRISVASLLEVDPRGLTTLMKDLNGPPCGVASNNTGKG